MATNRWRVKDFGVWWKNHVNTDAILLFGKGLYNIDSCMWKYDMWAGLCIYGTLFPTVLQDSQSICELHGISFLDLLLVYEYYIYILRVCTTYVYPGSPKSKLWPWLAGTPLHGSSNQDHSLFGLGLPEFIYFYIQMHTSTFQRVPSLTPRKMVNWHPEREPFGTQTGRSRYLYYIIYIKCISMDVKS